MYNSVFDSRWQSVMLQVFKVIHLNNMYNHFVVNLQTVDTKKTNANNIKNYLQNYFVIPIPTMQ